MKTEQPLVPVVWEPTLLRSSGTPETGLPWLSRTATASVPRSAANVPFGGATTLSITVGGWPLLPLQLTVELILM